MTRVTKKCLIYLYNIELGEVRYIGNNIKGIYHSERICGILRGVGLPANELIYVPGFIDVDEYGTHHDFRLNEWTLNDFAECTAPVASVDETKPPEDLRVFERPESNDMKKLQLQMHDFLKEDYPFVTHGFAAEGLTGGKPGVSIVYTTRMGKIMIDDTERTDVNGVVHHFVRLLVTGHRKVELMECIPRPEHFKSVKIVKGKDIIIKGCALLGYMSNQDNEDTWIGWNDFSGVLQFEFRCMRQLRVKHQDWEPNLQFIMFSARQTGKRWLVTEINYSDIKIVERENQWPCEVFYIDDLRYMGMSSGTALLTSRNLVNQHGEKLEVRASENNVKWAKERLGIDYGAIVFPFFSDDGRMVELHAIGVLPTYMWEDNEYLRQLSYGLYKWKLDNDTRIYTEPSSVIPFPKVEFYR